MGSLTGFFARWRRARPPVRSAPPPPPAVAAPGTEDAPAPRQRSYAVGDLARIHGSTPPFEEGERVNGYLTIRPGTIYLGNVEWWRYTEDPRQLHCAVCDCTVTNYYLAINHHVQQRHAPEQI